MVEYHFSTPILEGDVSILKLGDIAYISGDIFTARDEAHHRALKWDNNGKTLPLNIKGLPLYHCGPLVGQKDGGWQIISAGPTTSIRMEIFESEFIKRFNIPLVIGKGGMGNRTTEAMMNYGAAYLAFPGGAGALAAQSIKSVVDVAWLDLGIPEAMWYLNVECFGPLIVTIDSHGNNLNESLNDKFAENIKRMKLKLS